MIEIKPHYLEKISMERLARKWQTAIGDLAVSLRLGWRSGRSDRKWPSVVCLSVSKVERRGVGHY